MIHAFFFDIAKTWMGRDKPGHDKLQSMVWSIGENKKPGREAGF